MDGLPISEALTEWCNLKGWSRVDVKVQTGNRGHCTLCKWFGWNNKQCIWNKEECMFSD